MNIRRLTKTFLTLSLADVASRAGLSTPEEAEKWLVIMIEEGSIFASISQKDGKSKSTEVGFFLQKKIQFLFSETIFLDP